MQPSFHAKYLYPGNIDIMLYVYKAQKKGVQLMTSINAVIELSRICEKHNIKMSIDESGVILSAYRHGEKVQKHYDVRTINIISLDHPLQIIIDMFLEEYVYKFKKAIC